MSNIDVLIVEDEKIAADNLERLLLDRYSEIKVLAKIDSVRETRKWLIENSADLIFLDIHLSDGICFDIFRDISIITPIIFTTAYDQYAINAFKLNSIDYLLKPIDSSELDNAVKKFVTLQNEKNKQAVNVDELIRLISGMPQYQKRFMVYAGSKIRSVSVEDIAYFYIVEKAVFLVTKKLLSYPIEYSLDKLESILDPSLFFRINRRFIVQFSAIKNVITLSKSRLGIELLLNTDEELLVSFNRTPLFRKWLNQ